MFEASFHAASIGKAIVAVSGHIIEVNAAFAAMLGYEQHEIAGLHFAEFTHPADVDADLHLFNAVMQGAMDSYNLEKRYVRRDGSIVDVLLNATCIRDNAGAVLQFISEIIDLTEHNRIRRELEHANAELQRLVVTDHVTGLINRRGFEQALTSSSTASPLSVLLIDLDHFKRINDDLGHKAGDQVLAEVGRRLPGQVRCEDIVARVGGDEFGILIPGGDRLTATEAADRIVRELAEFTISGHVALVGASVGVSCSDGERSPPDLLGAADAALYEAKRCGRGQWKLAA